MAKRLLLTATKKEKLLAFLSNHLEASKRVIKKAIDHGAARRNGVIERFAATEVSPGDQITFDMAKLAVKKAFSLPILWEDETLLLCHKPSGLVTDAERFQKLLDHRVFLVHRLDKETSGVILLAKNQGMQRKLEDLFRKREVKKTYLALVKGRMRRDEGTIENRLGKKASYHGQTIWGSHKEGRIAITAWKCLEKGKGISLVECRPTTGRTHQIRVHLSEMGHPVLGDHQYGRKVDFPPEADRLCLHAYRLAFIHPKTGEKVQATAPVPTLFKSLMH